MALIIIDFDHTIVAGHTHNTVLEQIQRERKANNKKSETASNPELQWALIKAMPPIGSAQQWQQLFERLDKEGHQIAVASFSMYGNTLIPRYLKEVIGLSSDLVDKIFVNSWLPQNPTTADKNEHIKQIKEHFHYEDHPDASIVLVDDTLPNLIAAYTNGYSVIEATPQGAHFADMEHVSFTICSAENYQDFRDMQAGYANPLAFGKGIEKLISAARRGDMVDDNEEDTREKFYLIPAAEVEKQAANHKNSFLMTDAHELFFVDEAGKATKYLIHVDHARACFEQHGLSQQLATLTDRSLAVVLSNEAKTALNQLMTASHAAAKKSDGAFLFSDTSVSTLFSVEQKQEAVAGVSYAEKPLEKGVSQEPSKRNH